MEFKYFKFSKWVKEAQCTVVFPQLGTYECNIGIRYFLDVKKDGTKCNDLIFTDLGLDAESFVNNVLPYHHLGGTWPECKCMEDLQKVCKALEKEYDKQYPSYSGLLKRNKKINLNFEL